jgi:putative ABC transport system permease protein
VRRLATGLVGSFVEAWTELRIHRTRVLLSLIGVAVAVAALTSVVGLGAIAQQATQESLESGGGRPATLIASMYSSSGEPLDPEDARSAVQTAVERYGIDYYSADTYVQMRAQFVDGVADVNAQAVGADYVTIRRIRLVEGSWFAEGDDQRLAPALVVNEAFWQRLGSPDLRTHPTVTLLGDTTTTAVLIGVSESYEGDPTLSAFILDTAYPRVADREQLAALSPQYDFWVPEQIAQELQDALQRDLRGALGAGASVDVSRQDYAAYSDGEDPLRPIKLVVGGVAVLILFLGALSLVNISLVTMRQRIREIGVRRSFGATAGRVFFAVMMESVVGTIAAGVVGVFVSVLLVSDPRVTALVAPGATDLPGFPLEAALVGLGAATAVGALAGLLPAIVAIRVKVIDAIRF